MVAVGKLGGDRTRRKREVGDENSAEGCTHGFVDESTASDTTGRVSNGLVGGIEFLAAVGFDASSISTSCHPSLLF